MGAMVDSDMDMARGPLMLRLSLRPMPGWDMVDSTATDLALVMEVMAMVALDMAMERGLLMQRRSQRLMPSMVVSLATAMDSQLMVATAMDCGKKYRIP